MKKTPTPWTHEDAAEQRVDQVRRRRQVLDHQPRDQAAGRGAHHRRDRVRDRAPALVEVEQAGAGRRDRRRRPSRPWTTRASSRSGRPSAVAKTSMLSGLRRGGADQDRAPPDVVRQPAADQQRRQHRQRIDAEGEREHRGREAPLLLVDRIEGRRRARSGEEAQRHRRLQQEGRVRREAAACGRQALRGRSGRGRSWRRAPGMSSETIQTDLSGACSVQTGLVMSSPWKRNKRLAPNAARPATACWRRRTSSSTKAASTRSASSA